MVAKVERLAFSVNEAADLAGCGPYELLSRAVEKGVQVYTYLPEGNMAVTVDRRYVQGEPLYVSITESTLRWELNSSYPCIIGFLLDATDCLSIVQQRRSSRTFFDWGVVIAGKESPVKVQASDNEKLWLICAPPPSTDPDAYNGEAVEADFKTSEFMQNGPWAMGPHPFNSMPQLCFGAYPAGLKVTPDYAQLRIPRPREVVLHPDNLFLLKEAMEQLGLLKSQGGRLAPEGASRVAQESAEYPASPVSATSVEEPLDMGVGRVGEAADNRPTGVPAELVATVQFADFQVQDHWPFWLKELFRIASHEWVKWRKDQAALCTDDDRDRISRAILRCNREHMGRKLTPKEAEKCVTLTMPFWARHWEPTELRELSPASPVAPELQEMIEAAGKVQAFSKERAGRLTKTQVKEWLQDGSLHQFSKTQSDLVASLLLDFPKGGKNRGAL